MSKRSGFTKDRTLAIKDFAYEAKGNIRRIHEEVVEGMEDRVYCYGDMN